MFGPSTATAWTLFALTQSPRVQTKLREELLAIPAEYPTMEQLSSLPYLDAVVHEALRVHPPIPSLVRVAMEDDVIPLETPFMNRDGRMQGSLK